jgi:hypothetical protein
MLGFTTRTLTFRDPCPDRALLGGLKKSLGAPQHFAQWSLRLENNRDNRERIRRSC